MSTYQNIIIVGHIGNKAELKTFDNGCLSSFSVATTESYISKQTGQRVDNTEWHKCVAYGKSAENIVKYTDKGHKILINGKLKTRKYIDQNQIERYTTEIIVESFNFMQPKQAEPNPYHNYPQANQQPAQNNYNPNFDPNTYANNINEGDTFTKDNLPF